MKPGDEHEFIRGETKQVTLSGPSPTIVILIIFSRSSVAYMSVGARILRRLMGHIYDCVVRSFEGE